MTRDSLFWTAAGTAQELLIQAELLKKSGFTKPAEKAVAKAALLLFPLFQGKQVELPQELASLVKEYGETVDPFAKLELIEKIKNFD